MTQTLPVSLHRELPLTTSQVVVVAAAKHSKMIDPATSKVDLSIASTHPSIDWMRCLPFLLMHAALVAILWVGVSPIAIILSAVTLLARVFALTAFYHRYFSHRAFRTSRWFQFCGAALGACAVQRGPIWWAAHHRQHHRHSDDPRDPHSPRQLGFWFAHMGWFMTREHYRTNERVVKDWLRFPELRWLDRYDFVAPLMFAAGIYALGAALATWAPALETNGPQLLYWAFLVSTLVLYHVTYSINSIAHCIGTRRFETDDDSRNNWLLALVTFGEGWHNNHHRYPASARQGFFWWEIDLTYLVLIALAKVGIVWGLKGVPSAILNEGRADRTRTRRDDLHLGAIEPSPAICERNTP